MNAEKRRQPVRSGVLTVIIACVMIFLAVLSLLSLTSAHSDAALARRQLLYAQENAMAERTGQEWLAVMDDYLRADGDLPYGTTEDENTYSTTIRFSDNRDLMIRAEADQDGKLTITKWKIETAAETESLSAENQQLLTEDEDGYINILPASKAEGTGFA